MAEGGLRSLIIAVLLVGLIFFAMLSFANQFQVDMDANQTILNTSESNLNRSYSYLKANLSGAEETASDSREDFEGGGVETNLEDLNLKTIVGVGKRFSGVLAGFFGIIFDTVKTTFGFDKTNSDNASSFTVIIGTLGGIFLVVILFYTWRFIKAGS